VPEPDDIMYKPFDEQRGYEQMDKDIRVIFDKYLDQGTKAHPQGKQTKDLFDKTITVYDVAHWDLIKACVVSYVQRSMKDIMEKSPEAVHSLEVDVVITMRIREFVLEWMGCACERWELVKEEKILTIPLEFGGKEFRPRMTELGGGKWAGIESIQKKDKSVDLKCHLYRMVRDVFDRWLCKGKYMTV